MPSPTEITVAQLARLVGTPDAPTVLDVRTDEDFDDDPRLIPGARRHVFEDAESLAPGLRHARVIRIACPWPLRRFVDPDARFLHELAPESAGLLAASLGLSRMYRDDLQQLDAGMALYDAFYRWARDATDEGHDWPAPGPRGRTPA